MSFLDVLLGDEPVLSPQAHFYQRLLALDEEGAREIAVKYIKENPQGNLYDSVLVPALGLAEQDRHMNALDETRVNFIHQNVRELIEELSEDSPAIPEDDISNPTRTTASLPFGMTIGCIPARDDADEIVGTMIVQLLQHEGHDATAIPIASLPAMLDKLDLLDASVVCVSALPPFAVGQAKSVCKQVRQRFPKVKIVLGLWGFSGGGTKAQEKVGVSCTDAIATSLAQMVSLVGNLASLDLVPSDSGEHQR